MSWQDILDVLINDRLADIFCQQFAERSELSPELDEDGNIKPETKRKYILSLMVEYLSHRPLTAAAPETMGLFTSYYEQLEPALNDKLPDEIENSTVTYQSKIKLPKGLVCSNENFS